MNWMQAAKWTSEMNYRYADGNSYSLYIEWMMYCTKGDIAQTGR